MTLRVCIDCMATIPAGRSRCRPCERIKDRERGTTTQRGYGAEHEAVARGYQRQMDQGQRFACWRCGRELGTRRGSDWHLGHCDNDRGIYHGPEHPACNLATAGRAAPCPHLSHI
jgi:hypothetical protein